MIRLFILIICFVHFSACSNSQTEQETKEISATGTSVAITVKDTFTKGTLLPHVACLADASQSYALYIPATLKTTSLPVLFCFDPHGDGALPLQHYKTLADQFGFIMIGSNNSKNGNDWTTTQTILNTLFTDVKNRVVFNQARIYALGFSGGAKVAGYAALHQQGIQGIIVSGAGLPDDEAIRGFPFSITAMAGRGDMNMTDLVAMNAALDGTSTVHRLVLFDGKHAWPPADDMRAAFTAIQFDAMRNNTSLRNDSAISTYITRAKNEIKKEEAAHQWLHAEQSCEVAINLLMNLTNTASFSDEQTVIKHNPLYAQQQQLTEHLLAQEEEIKQAFQQQFSQGDMSYWKNAITTLQQKAKGTTPEAAMNQRLLAYLSLAFYSLSNRLISGNQNDAAQHFVALYKMADATNAEAWYFSAILNARNNNAAATQSDLIQAASFGFIDTARLHQQPEFLPIASQLNFGVIESKMKAAAE